MDGLRKVPDNVPEQEMLTAHLGQPLTKIPDPFGTHESFAHHNNATLRHFLDRYGFDYEFLSATECYTSGRFDEVIRQVLRNWDGVMGVMLPTLREERRQTYSPILPISPTSRAACSKCRSRSSTPRRERSPSRTRKGRVEQSALGGNAKLQWKVDWAARWVALGVDYEMAGKDLIDSVTQSSKIARVLGGRPPEGFNYEMFLDEKGEKISKSKGNGLSLEEWLRYGSEPSLAFYIYREPKKAKSLHLGSSRARSTNIGSSAAIIRTSRSSSNSATRCTTSTTAMCPSRKACRLPTACCSTSSACRAFTTRRLPGVSCSAMRRTRRRTRMVNSTS